MGRKVFELDSPYQSPQFRSQQSDELILKRLGLCIGCMNVDFQGLSSNGKPKERYEVRFGTKKGCYPFSLTCSLCQLLWREVLDLTPEEATSHEVTFNFTPIESAAIHRGTKNNVLIGLWYSGGSKSGHLVFSASPGKSLCPFQLEKAK